MIFHLACRRFIAVVVTAALLCLPVAGQCLGSVSAHAAIAIPDTPAIELTEHASHGQMDHAANQHHATNQHHEANQHQATSPVDRVLSDCCDGFTCDMSGCTSLTGGHIQAISHPEFLKNSTNFARASVAAAASQPSVFFKPPIYS